MSDIESTFKIGKRVQGEYDLLGGDINGTVTGVYGNAVYVLFDDMDNAIRCTLGELASPKQPGIEGTGKIRGLVR